MRRIAPIAGLVGAVLLALVMAAALVVSADAYRTGSGARRGAQRLHDSRVEVARAQERVGGSNLDEALASARAANSAAEKVGRITARVARLLQTTRVTAAAITAASRRGSRSVVFTRRQSEAAARSLFAISRYQTIASRSATVSNRALQRILRALRQTNENFPGGDGAR